MSFQLLAELGLFAQQPVGHLGNLLCRALLVVARHSRVGRFLELPLGPHKQLLVNVLRRYNVT